MFQTKLTTLRALLFITLLFALGCETDTNDHIELGDNPFGVVSKDSSILEIIAQSFVLQDFEALLVTSRVAGEMKSPPYTVFTPWDTAFDRLPYWTKITRNRAWHGHLRDLALAHIHEGNLPPELIDGDTTVTMMNGDDSSVSKGSGRIRVDGISYLADTPASDGHLYMLDGVREPKWTKRTILDIITSDERFSILAQILNHPSMSAKREELRYEDAELTFFAPTNEALVGFDVEQCEEPECLDLLKQIVENHIVPAVVPKMFTPTKELSTQSGASLNWNFDAQSITCSKADETLEEIGLDGIDEEFALNGIVQPVNKLPCTLFDSSPKGELDKKLTTPRGPEYFGISSYGTKDILVFNFVVTDNEDGKYTNLSASEINEAFFSDQPYSLRSWYRTCSNDHLNLVPSAFGGVIDIEIDTKTLNTYRAAEKQAFSQFQETFGQNPSFSVGHLVRCFPKGHGSNGYARPISHNGLPKDAAVSIWLYDGHCTDAALLHEVGHAIGLEHSSGFGDNGQISEYGDTTSTMGWPWHQGTCFSGPDLWRTGWFKEQNISIQPTKGSSQEVTIATLLDSSKAKENEYIVVRLGDYYLRYNVSEPALYPKSYNDSEEKMNNQVTIARNVFLPGIDTVLLAGIGIERSNVDSEQSHLGLVKSLYGIEKFNGTDTLYVKACSVFEGDEQNARSMTISIGYDLLELCGESRSQFASVSENSDYASENLQDGTMVLKSQQLEFFGSGPAENRIGLRFSSLDIPKNAQITHAYVQFQGAFYGASPSRVYMNIEGEKTTSPSPFTTEAGNLSIRERTDASVLWKTHGWERGDRDFTERTPNLKNIVQELVNQDGWVQGDDIILLFERSNLGRNPDLSTFAQPHPKLIVTYEYRCPNESSCLNLTPNDGFFKPGDKAGIDGTSAPIAIPEPNPRKYYFPVPGVITEGELPGFLAEYAFDGDETTLWSHDTKSGPRLATSYRDYRAPWIQLHPSSEQSFSSYEITFSANHNRTPKRWRLFGYDGLSSWQQLDEQEVSASDLTGQGSITKRYNISDGESFVKYHFVFDINNEISNTFIEIAEISFQKD